MAAACSSAPEEIDESRNAETWNQPNDPHLVDDSYVYDVGLLPLEGQTASPPIAGDYWATYRDAINWRWDGPGSLSPAEKFEKAYERPGVSDAISSNYGIDSQSRRRSCKTKSDCDSLGDRSECGIRNGEETGRCIPRWFGICHGWAPYAFMEPVAKHPVTKNGVTFYPGDLTGLRSMVYAAGYPHNRQTSKFLSERCNDPAIATLHGRPIESDCRDMNPGSFHVLAANRLGLRHTSFVVDRTQGAEVWNQPVRGFKVLNAEGGKLKEVTRAEAAALVGGDSYFGPEAKKFYHVVANMYWITEALSGRTAANADRQTRADQLEYVLEADVRKEGNEEIPFITGGEWVGDSRLNELDKPSGMGNQNGHPDFAWWPTEAPSVPVASGLMTYEEIKALNDEAATDEAPTTTPTTDADAGAPTAPTTTDAGAPATAPTTAPTTAPSTPPTAPTAPTTPATRPEPAIHSFSIFSDVSIHGMRRETFGTAEGGHTVTFEMSASKKATLTIDSGLFQRPLCEISSESGPKTCSLKIPAGGGSYRVTVKSNIFSPAKVSVWASVR